MPFELIITREDYSGSGSPKPVFLSRLFGNGSTTSKSPLTEADFHAVMEDAPILKRADERTYWLSHPKGIPWMAAGYQDSEGGSGEVHLSISYAHYLFPVVFADAFDAGIRIASALEARLFEEVGNREITAGNIDRVLDAKGKYVSDAIRFWRSTVDQLDREAQAPFEIPIGPVDAVSEYLIFHITPSAPTDLSQIAKALNWKVTAESSMEENGKLLGVITTNATGKGETKIHLRPDGKIQVQPYYWDLPFAEVAQNTVAIAEQVTAYVKGTTTFNFHEYTEQLKHALSNNIHGLAVEYYQWLSSHSS